MSAPIVIWVSLKWKWVARASPEPCCAVAHTPRDAHRPQPAPRRYSEMGFGEPEIKVVKDTWEVVKTLPAETVGGLLFKHIFEQADVSALFSFGRVEGFDPNPEAVAANPAVMKHGGKVVGTVSVAVSMLDDLPNLVPVLKDLGVCALAASGREPTLIPCSTRRSVRLALPAGEARHLWRRRRALPRRRRRIPQDAERWAGRCVHRRSGRCLHWPLGRGGGDDACGRCREGGGR